ncbi:hypothetical protein J437_LFUL004275 [Ladona fulva]|uniref:Integrase catalytic domain-containing protein n=1 Tax=Ladona fulva TaxID=123851 RepID=A0A8K0KIR5_LADFU|nr:hypothetical protein J437_LFUL004275 [Ladona fulva]
MGTRTRKDRSDGKYDAIARRRSTAEKKKIGRTRRKNGNFNAEAKQTKKGEKSSVDSVQVIESIYNEPGHWAGFSTFNNLHEATGIARKTIREWLDAQEAYTRHKPVRKKFQRNSYDVSYTCHGVKFYTTNNPDVKANIVEGFNRTPKTKMYKYFTKYSTYNYADVLPKLVSGYKNSVHSTTGIQPSKVTDKNAFVIASRLQMKARAKKKLKFNIGDYVRISKECLPFAKGYTPNYTSEIFSVVGIDRTTQVPTYKLQDMNGENIKGNFYAEELVRVNITPETEYKIEKNFGT